MSTEIDIARKAAHDKFEAEIRSAQAKLETLRAKASAAKADAEVKVIGDLFTKKQAIDRKLAELKLKHATEAAYQQAKTDVQAKVAELQQSVQAIEAKFKTAQPAR